MNIIDIEERELLTIKNLETLGTLGAIANLLTNQIVEYVKIANLLSYIIEDIEDILQRDPYNVETDEHCEVICNLPEFREKFLYASSSLIASCNDFYIYELRDAYRMFVHMKEFCNHQSKVV